MNIKFNELKNKSLSECKREIKPLAKLPNGNEYNSYIADYYKEQIAVTNRFISPYITSQTHGDVFKDLVPFIKSLKINNLLDLGCGAGEFLSKFKDTDITLYGVTIHLGEVKYAREIYQLDNVVGMDMREIDEYFDVSYFDCIIAHCSFNFITNEDRIDVLKRAHKILKQNGYFIVVDYKGIEDTKLPENWGQENYYQIIYTPDIYVMGNLTIYKKI